MGTVRSLTELGTAALPVLLVAGRRLLEVDPDSFYRVLAAALAFLAANEEPDEPPEVFAARLTRISARVHEE